MIFAIIAGLILLSVIIGLDVYFATDAIKGDTWSEMIRKLSHLTTLIPWAWGVLAGHFFHPNLKPLLKFPNNIALLVWLTVATTIIGSFFIREYHSPWLSLIIMFVAVFVGAKLWPAS